MFLDYDAKYVRLILRVYFNIAFLSFAIIGNQCCVQSVKLALLRTGSVPLTRMTGWLTTFDPAKALYKLRRLPCGWIGALMIVCAILSLTSDLAVSAWVHSVTIAARCHFDQGMVVSPTKIPTFNVIPNNGNPYQVAAQAQLISQVNGGKTGIYWKANRVLNFRADDSDTIGSWDCQDLEKDQQYSAETPALDIVHDLQHKGLLFPGTSLHEDSSWANGSSGHLVAWTSSESGPGKAFSVRASVDLSSHVKDDKIMRSFFCNMNAPQVEWVLAMCHSIHTLKQWTPCFQGSMYDGTGTPAVANVSDKIEWLLNSMVMVGGSGNNLLLKAPEGQDTQGCLTSRTSIPWPVIVIFGIVTVILVLLPLYLLLLLAQLQRWTSDEKSVFKHAPDDLLSWVAQAARETRTGAQESQTSSLVETVKYKNMVQWQFGTVGEGKPPGVKNKGSDDGEVGIKLYQGVNQHQGIGQNHVHGPQKEGSEVGVQEVQGQRVWTPYRAEAESSTSLLIR